VVLVGAAALSLAGLTMGARLGEIAPDVVFAAGAVMAFALLVLHEWGSAPAAVLARVRALGACSYTLYLTHVPVVVLLAAFWKSRYGTVPGDGWLAMAGVAIATTFALAVAPLVEAPFAGRTGVLVRDRAPMRRRRARRLLDAEMEAQGSDHGRRAA
jgi:peptidoglycan/LPS O-acetylase OafA/YrhL